jgi:hypothetical protein
VNPVEYQKKKAEKELQISQIVESILNFDWGEYNLRDVESTLTRPDLQAWSVQLAREIADDL